ncbi:DNA polymerase IV [Microbacterium sp. Root61]|uniref:DNA polymerase IV n=1 Tax=Microbacterium sp. Root61 TaxID=1736570 RepID=UPI0006FB92E3|nr:DNA polymerase IV [Microbacterium sp. Root61]KRA23221.1 DNA polymerase IV [Microbacterium sp. Root61]
MGRGDGTGRLVSLDGADDSGTGILHVDMDAFYASVEVLDNPSLKGKPIIIGAPEGRSVVSSASYEARRFGVRSAMPVSQALRLCPHAIVVMPHFERYLALSAQVMEIFHTFTPLVEPLSIDEAFLDVRGARRLWGSPGAIGHEVRRRVLAETGLTCSVGVAATKHVAKMASTISKPDGLLIVAAHDTAAFLGPRSVRAMWGVGPKAAESLEGRGIHTIADVRDTPQDVLARALGPAMGERVWSLARGVDPREVSTHRVEKSIGHEETFHEDVSDLRMLRVELRRLADRVGARLRKNGWEASTIAIKVRFADFSTVNRSQTLESPTAVGQRIGDAAHELFDAIDLRGAVRLVGVRAEKLQHAGGAALALWDDDEEWRRVEGALDDATARFGRGAVTRAAHLGRGPAISALPSNPLPTAEP